MGLNFLQQQNKLSRICGDAATSSDDMWPLADRKLEINRGEIMFAKKSKSLLGYIKGTVTSQVIALPTGFLEIVELILNNINLTGRGEMALQDFDRSILSGDDRYYFWPSATNVRQIKFIDSNSNGLPYILYYLAKPSVALSADTDESPFEDEYREASVFYAASELLPQIGKFKLGDYYKGKFLDLAEEARIAAEQKYLSTIRAFPDVGDQYQYDQDREGYHNSGGMIS